MKTEPVELRQRIIGVKRDEIRDVLARCDEIEATITRLHRSGFDTVFPYGSLERYHPRP